MKKVSEKINEKRMGGFMKIRLMAVVLGAIAIMMSGVAGAQTTGTVDYTKPFLNLGQVPIESTGSVKINWNNLFGNSDSENSGTGLSAWKCVIENRDNWDKLNDSLEIISDGVLGFKALENSHYRDTQQYAYLNNVASLNNTWRMMDSALDYSTQQQIAYYQYRYGSTYNSGSGNYNSQIRNYASDVYNNYSDNWWNNN